MGEYVMICSIFICLFVLALLAFAKPLRVLCRFLFSAATGSAMLFLGQSFGVQVGINVVTVLISGLLGLPGTVGILLLSILL